MHALTYTAPEPQGNLPEVQHFPALRSDSLLPQSAAPTGNPSSQTDPDFPNRLGLCGCRGVTGFW